MYEACHTASLDMGIICAFPLSSAQCTCADLLLKVRSAPMLTTGITHFENKKIYSSTNYSNGYIILDKPCTTCVSVSWSLSKHPVDTSGYFVSYLPAAFGSRAYVKYFTVTARGVFLPFYCHHPLSTAALHVDCFSSRRNPRMCPCELCWASYLKHFP